MKRPSGTAGAGLVTLNVSKEHRIVRMSANIPPSRFHSHIILTRLDGPMLIMGIEMEGLEVKCV